ncbi:hypothetical protein LshimejAT787_0410900 [Lyophyllum shimeji]|uniref:Uncharacterized protein n=1 Tax=Lyophyllum shimeji TaxID=47721 RepID=A0A9P3PMA1_LYOSH|nr:hypothetical protein LshimejAT787_0410900 [Lyophyllum shimeji]
MQLKSGQPSPPRRLLLADRGHIDTKKDAAAPSKPGAELTAVAHNAVEADDASQTSPFPPSTTAAPPPPTRGSLLTAIPVLEMALLPQRPPLLPQRPPLLPQHPPLLLQGPRPSIG